VSEDFDVNTIGFQIGSISRFSPYDGLTDEQGDELQAELEARDARRVPLGFRATRPKPLRPWPTVPRFDLPEARTDGA
jgi:hypothetical protein